MRPMLLMFIQQGCPSCEMARPEFEKFKRRNPMQLALEMDADGPFPSHFKVKIHVTPTYVLKNDEMGVVHEGAMKAEQIEKWVRAAIGATEEGRVR